MKNYCEETSRVRGFLLNELQRFLLKAGQWDQVPRVVILSKLSGILPKTGLEDEAQLGRVLRGP